MINRDHEAVQATRRWIERWPPFPADPDDPDDDGTFGISPLIAYLLHQTLRDMADDWTDDLGDLTRRQMPRSLSFWSLDDEFTQAMARSCDDLANRLAAGPRDAPARCTADEINLAIACRLTTESFTGLEPPDPTRDELARLAPPTDLDDELSLARELLTDDFDVDLLWNPAHDGIEDDDTLQDQFRFANLHPTTWFDTFNDLQPTDPETSP